MAVPELERTTPSVGASAASNGNGQVVAPELVDYRTLVEQIPAITYTEIHDRSNATDQRTTYVSPQAARMLGHAPADFLADPQLWRKLRHPADRPRVLAAERTAEITRRPFHAEYRMITRDGRLLWFRDEAVIVEDGSGGTFWQGVMFDVTAEKLAEEQARNAERRYRSLVETLPAVVYMDELNERATNVYTSPQSERLIGYTAKEWNDDPDMWLKLLHPEDHDRAVAAQTHHVETGEPYDETYRIVARDGRVLWIRDVAVVVYEEDGTPLYSQGFLLDITGLKDAELALQEALDREHEGAEALRAMDELKNTLLHTLSHDLKGPLTAILASATALQRPDLLEREAAELLQGMAQRAKRMDRLLTDMLDLERLGRGVIEPTCFPVDVGQLVADLVRGSDALQGRRVELDTPPVVVPVDPPKLERVIENLLTNAARHTPSSSRLWVRVVPESGGALIAVEDEGPGVPDEHKLGIFEPFRRGPDPLGAGSGLGLSLVARFTQLHGGRAWVDDRPGGGASFRVFLPGAKPVGSETA
ncbi:MAG: PAS domain-containing protein [Solirubrobacterales bacterium]